MPNASRTRVLASCLACLTIATANIALANDEPTPSSGPQLEAASDQTNQQPNQSDVSRDAQRSADQQQQRGRQGASLGVNITSSGQGVVVTRVQADTPAQQMGLRPNDRIISINGAPAGSADEFISTIRGMNPGDQIELGIVRDNGERTIRGELEAYGQALTRNEQPTGSDEFRNYQRILGQNRWTSNEPSDVSRDEGTTERGLRSAEPSAPRFNDADRSANLQASYDEKNTSARPQSGDIDARLSRIEQQIDRLTQAVEELRNTIGTAPLTDRPTSGLREAASAEFRATNQTRTQPRPTAPLPSGDVLKRNDRWSAENRFEQGDLSGARDRATAEAARRRAQQTGSQLQQQERDRAAKTQPNTQPSSNADVPPQPTTDQLPSDQPKL